jgi:hypothetical protein
VSRFMSAETWARHANPWSGWTRLLTYPLLYLPLWLHNWYLLGIVALWRAVNPRLFPKPRGTENWMSKGVLGKQCWTQRWHWDLPMLLSMIAVLCFIGAVYTAYMRMFWALLCFASSVLVLKLWFVDRMVRLYEDDRRIEAKTHVDVEKRRR